jgi:hypothetical protein
LHIGQSKTRFDLSGKGALDAAVADEHQRLAPIFAVVAPEAASLVLAEAAEIADEGAHSCV